MLRSQTDLIYLIIIVNVIRALRECKSVMKGLTYLPCETRTIAQKLLTEWPRTRKDELAFTTVRAFFLRLLRGNPDDVLKIGGIDMVANWTLEYMDTIATDAVKMNLPCSHNHEQELQAFWLRSGNPPFDTLRPIRNPALLAD